MALSNDGKILAVAAQNYGDNNAGAIFVFKYNSRSKQFQFLALAEPTTTNFGNFGRSMALSGNARFLLGGTPFATTSDGGSGSVYTYRGTK